MACHLIPYGGTINQRRSQDPYKEGYSITKDIVSPQVLFTLSHSHHLLMKILLLCKISNQAYLWNILGISKKEAKYMSASQADIKQISGISQEFLSQILG